MKRNNDKKLMKEYLDMQVDEKRRTNQFEKSLDNEQARIWKIDSHKFYEQEKEVTHRYFYLINLQIRSLNNIKSQFLKSQIDSKHSKKSTKMSDIEFVYNQGLLKKIKYDQNE